MPSIRSQKVRTAKLASKVLSRDHIGKAPSDIEAARASRDRALLRCLSPSATRTKITAPYRLGLKKLDQGQEPDDTGIQGVLGEPSGAV
jgi:hypothetical protein